MYRSVWWQRRERGPYDAAVIHPILDEALFCTVSYADAGREPVSIPTNYTRVDNYIYLHGKSSSELIRRMSNGAFVSINVTIVSLDSIFAAPLKLKL